MKSEEKFTPYNFKEFQIISSISARRIQETGHTPPSVRSDKDRKVQSKNLLGKNKRIRLSDGNEISLSK